jgi:hypothetical protein
MARGSEMLSLFLEACSSSRCQELLSIKAAPSSAIVSNGINSTSKNLPRRTGPKLFGSFSKKAMTGSAKACLTRD